MAKNHSETKYSSFYKTKDTFNSDLEIVKDKKKGNSKVNVSPQRHKTRLYPKLVVNFYTISRGKVSLTKKNLLSLSIKRVVNKIMTKRIKNNLRRFTSILSDEGKQTDCKFPLERKFEPKVNFNSSEVRYCDKPSKVTTRINFLERKQSLQFIKLSPQKKNRRGLKFEIDYSRVKTIIKSYKQKNPNSRKFQQVSTRNPRLVKSKGAPSQRYNEMYDHRAHSISKDSLRLYDQKRMTTSNAHAQGDPLPIQKTCDRFYGIKSHTNIKTGNRFLESNSFSNTCLDQSNESDNQRRCICSMNSENNYFSPKEIESDHQDYCPRCAYSSYLSNGSYNKSEIAGNLKIQSRYLPIRENLTFYGKRRNEITLKDRNKVLLKIRKL
ncbi:unnamed protein product [Moneuplotes crassus]|uniref:Uncharacterized protein n=1 Tax=Euplotes crassus TaxID=5936 RepID=A0AAD1USI5_EUPCR|nr:unnamed protein product [Moneuplotes crassus]